jgi:hypothetical protein
MNTPSPLVPQGTFLGKPGRSHIRIAVFTILAIHVVLLGALLLQGCKRTTAPVESAQATNATFSIEDGCRAHSTAISAVTYRWRFASA